MENLRKNICDLWSSVKKINNNIHSILTEGIGTEKDPVDNVVTKKLFLGTENELLFIDTIKKILSFDIKSLEPTKVNVLFEKSEFTYEDNVENKIIFFLRNHEPSIFINLIISVLFRAFITNNSEVNFQGANSAVRYFAINIFPITKIYKNIPYYTYPSTNYWTVLTIDTNGDWVNNVKFFSITPYIGQYTSNNTTKDYLANCNTSITSTLLKADHPHIFSKKRDTVRILYTFDKLFGELFYNPPKKQYVVLLPNMIDSSTFTFMARFEKKTSLTSTNFTKSIRSDTFSDYPFFHHHTLSNGNIELVSSSFLATELKNYPVLTSNYSTNQTNIDNFICNVQTCNQNYKPLKIYPYFYLSNNNKLVTNVYDLIDDNSDTNALINDFNKNYYNSEKIKIRDSNGKLLYSKFLIIALNHVQAGISTSNNIQIYNVENQKSIKTYETSNELPYLSDDLSPSTVYEVPQSQSIYTFEIDTSVEWLKGVNEIAFFERICYPVAFKDNGKMKNPGPRYTSFKIDHRFPQKNPSINCSKEDVEKENVYLIKSNDPEFSLHLNYCKYSTLNFRVFSL